MKQHYECARCGARNEFSLYVRARMMVEATVDRCNHCGAAHAVLRGDTEVISRPMQPIDFPHGVVSAWILWKYRPVQIGKYECRFNDTEPNMIVLWWNGHFFQVSANDNRNVDMRTFMGWRGVWA